MFRAVRSLADVPRVTMVAVGGGASRALDAAVASGRVPSTAAISTDARTLEESLAATKLQIGVDELAGMGTGGEPEAGRAAASRDVEPIRGLFTDRRLALVATCLGGGTGTGATPIVLNAAREAGAVTVCIATLPFSFEGAARRKVAEVAVEALRGASDVLVVLGNDEWVGSTGRTGLAECFQAADHALGEALNGLWELLVTPCFVGIDLADLQRLGGAGVRPASFAFGQCTASEGGAVAARALLESPLFGAITARSERIGYVLVAIMGGPSMAIGDVEAAMGVLNPKFTPETDVQVGVLVREEFEGQLRVVLFCAPSMPMSHARRPTRRQPVASASSGKKHPSKARARQAKLRLDAPEKRRFKDVAPTILDGEDLDVPTFIRRSITVRHPA